LPTETVYGLGGDATRDDVVAKIFATKNRPNFNPLISHVTGLEMAVKYGVFDELAIKIAEKFWCGPLTLVVPKLDGGVCDLACAGLETIALRAPNHRAAQEIIAGFGKPIAAPSANVSGSISPTSAQDVATELGDNLGMIIDGGDCVVGLESTVVGVFDGEIHLLRKGYFTAADIEKAIGTRVLTPSLNDENAPKSPGMLLRHYSPKTPMILNADSADEDEVFLAFGKIPQTVRGQIIQLSETQNLTEAAANLYRAMRNADLQTPKTIKVASIPNTGLGEAINDRLMRAAGG
jgi:L-threonylcarbamoyladenylate synthase